MHQEWFFEHSEIVSKRDSILSDQGESLIKLVDLKSIRYGVRPIDHNELEIIDGHLNPRINLYERTCMFG